MAGVLGYTKKFIILKKDYGNISGLNPKGHGKIEIKGLKGNFSLSLENAESDQFYNVLLVGKDNSYVLGKVYTDKSGKGREEIDFNLSDLESKGFSMDKLNGILISRDKDILMGAYTGKEDGSIERYIKSMEAVPEKEEEPKLETLEILEEPKVEQESIIELAAVEEKMEEQEEIEEIILIEEQPMVVDKFEERSGISEEPEIVEELQEKDPEIVENVEILEESEVLVESEILIESESEPFVPEFEPIADLSFEEEPVAIELDEIEEINTEEINTEEIITEAAEELTTDLTGFEETAAEVEFEPEVQANDIHEENISINDFEYDHSKKVIQRTQTVNYVLSILRYFPYVDPFSVALSGYNWWRIDYQIDDKGFLPYFNYVTGDNNGRIYRSKTSITPVEMMAVHGHYIFGLYNEGEDVKYFVYGVPGGFYKEEHPFNGATGFNTWFPGNEVSGYWLMYIDPLTGEVIYPINPMYPID